MRKIRKLFHKSLGNRLLLYFVLMTMIPLILAGSLIYLRSEKLLGDTTLSLASKIVESSKTHINTLFNDMQELAKMIEQDSIMQDLLQKDDSNMEYENIQYELKRSLLRLCDYYQYINDAYLVLDNGIIAKSRYYSVREPIGLPAEKYISIHDHSDIHWYRNQNGSIIVDNMGASVIGMAKTLMNKKTGYPCGIIVIEVKQETIRKMLNLELGQESAAILVDSNNNLMYSLGNASEELIADVERWTSTNAVGNNIEIIKQKNYLLMCVSIPSNGWVLSFVVFYDFLRENGRNIFNIFIAVAVTSFLVIVWISNKLKNYELKPINRMIYYVNQVEKGNFGHHLDVVRNDEIGALSGNINEMADRIRDLIESVKHEEKQKRRMEYKALQAQINPHFLYNTLDSIKWLSNEGETQKAAEMVMALASYYRISLSKGHDVISVNEEIEHVRSYLTIQKIRYEKQFEYKIYVDSNIEKCFVPKLILQPLVENSIYHGIKLSNHKCQIFINTIESGQNILLEVIDNGIGMDKEQVEKLLKAIKDNNDNQVNSYGLININNRVQIFAGKEYGLTIESEQGLGTVVQIKLPKSFGRAKDV